VQKTHRQRRQSSHISIMSSFNFPIPITAGAWAPSFQRNLNKLFLVSDVLSMQHIFRILQQQSRQRCDVGIPAEGSFKERVASSGFHHLLTIFKNSKSVRLHVTRLSKSTPRFGNTSLQLGKRDWIQASDPKFYGCPDIFYNI